MAKRNIKLLFFQRKINLKNEIIQPKPKKNQLNSLSKEDIVKECVNESIYENWADEPTLLLDDIPQHSSNTPSLFQTMPTQTHSLPNERFLQISRHHIALITQKVFSHFENQKREDELYHLSSQIDFTGKDVETNLLELQKFLQEEEEQELRESQLIQNSINKNNSSKSDNGSFNENELQKDRGYGNTSNMNDKFEKPNYGYLNNQSLMLEIDETEEYNQNDSQDSMNDFASLILKNDIPEKNFQKRKSKFHPANIIIPKGFNFLFYY